MLYAAHSAFWRSFCPVLECSVLCILSRVSLKFICLISDLTPVNDVVTSGLETMARILVTDLGDSYNTSDKLAISWKLGRDIILIIVVTASLVFAFCR